MSDNPLADALVGTGSKDYAFSPTMGMFLTAWNPTTRENTVTDGAVTYTNLFCLNPADLAVGRVLIVQTGGRPVILGNLYGPTV